MYTLAAAGKATSQATTIVTPPPRNLGSNLLCRAPGQHAAWVDLYMSSGKPAVSPKSEAKMTEAKMKKQHLVVRDHRFGFLCKLCGNSGDLADIQAKRCFPLPDFEVLEKPSSSKPSEAELLQRELDALAEEERQLQQLLQLQQLQEYEAALEAEDERMLELAFEQSRREKFKEDGEASARIQAEAEAIAGARLANPVPKEPSHLLATSR